MMSSASYYMDLVNVAFSMMICGMFVLMTYIHPESCFANFCTYMEKIISVYFVFNYVLRLVLADFPLQKAREIMIIDLCTTLPVFIDFLWSVGSERYDSYLCLLDILRVLRIARMHHLEAYIDK